MKAALSLFSFRALWASGICGLISDYPGFSLVALGYQMKDAQTAPNLVPPERQYDLKCDPKDTPYTEDYKIWLAFMEFSKGKKIASQQMAEAAK